MARQFSTWRHHSRSTGAAWGHGTLRFLWYPPENGKTNIGMFSPSCLGTTASKKNGVICVSSSGSEFSDSSILQLAYLVVIYQFLFMVHQRYQKDTQLQPLAAKVDRKKTPKKHLPKVNFFGPITGNSNGFRMLVIDHITLSKSFDQGVLTMVFGSERWWGFSWGMSDYDCLEDEPVSKCFITDS